MHMSGQTHGFGHAAKIIVHDDYVRRLSDDVRAGLAHGKTDVRCGQGGRVVDAVPHHADGVAAFLALLLDRFQLLLRQQAGLYLTNAGLNGNGMGSSGVVARQHDGSNAHGLQFAHCLLRGGLDRVGHSQQGQRSLLIGQNADAAALTFMFSHTRLQLG